MLDTNPVLRSAFALALGAALAFAAPAQAQSFPSRAVHIVVPYPAGGGIDILARVIAQRLSRQWDQPVVVDNRPGANTLIGAEAVAHAPADGHTLLLTSDATFTINPWLYTKLPYDPLKDFAPITLLVNFHQLLVANAAVPANTLGELIALAKREPGKLSYASYGPGSQPQLAMEMLKSKAGINILHVPYKGIAPAVTAVLAGEVQFTFSGVASSLAHIRAGRLKAIAIGGAHRSPLLPQVPTFAELGFPEVDSSVWFGTFAPAGTPSETIAKIHRDTVALFADPPLREKEIVQKGYDWNGAGPAEFAAAIRAELARRKEVVRISGAHLE